MTSINFNLMPLRVEQLEMQATVAVVSGAKGTDVARGAAGAAGAGAPGEGMDEVDGAFLSNPCNQPPTAQRVVHINQPQPISYRHNKIRSGRLKFCKFLKLGFCTI